jgi:uncharacterized protein (DUF1501 family)
VEQEGQGAEQQNLNKKLNAERDTERIAGMAETAWEKAAAETETTWEKAAVGKKMETAKTTVQTTMRTAEGTRKTAGVNMKTEGGSLYQNRRHTRQTDSRTILYTLKQKKTNREQEQELDY